MPTSLVVQLRKLPVSKPPVRHSLGFCPHIPKEGKSAINLNKSGEISSNLAPGYFFMLGRSAASKIIYVGPVGGPKNTGNKGDNPNRRDSLDPPRGFICAKIIYGTVTALNPGKSCFPWVSGDIPNFFFPFGPRPFTSKDTHPTGTSGQKSFSFCSFLLPEGDGVKKIN